MPKAKSDAKVRRWSLKPIIRRPRQSFDKTQYFEALRRLDERALGESAVMQLRNGAPSLRKSSEDWTDPAQVRTRIKFAKALYSARRISRHEFVLFAVVPVENIHEKRITKGEYPELENISNQILAIEKEYGLAEDEYWMRGEGPKEHRDLNDEYNSINNLKFVEALEEFDLPELADLCRNSKAEFDELRERGRRSVFHKSEYPHALRDIIMQNEHDARRAASAKAYRAAITSLGAGIEALLLLRCLRSPHKASRLAAQLPKRLRPSKLADPKTWTFETFIEVCSTAGWFTPIETPVASYSVVALAHVLRRMRNYVHPNRMARERPWATTDEQEFDDALAIYTVLMTSVGNIQTIRESS